MSAQHYFTLIFEGDLTRFTGNPFRTDTPFGRPIASGLGSAFDEVDAISVVGEAYAGFVGKVARLALHPPEDGDEPATWDRLINEALELLEHRA